MTEFFDTIAAVSTPRGKGGVALIRISGREAFSVADAMFLPANGIRLSDTPASRAVYGNIVEDDGFAIDDGIATVFRAPHSFTGEDTVEISCHGGALITQKVLELAFLCGARPAGAGEFTRRAFINGKISLERAEAIGGLLEAQTEAQLRIFSSGSASALSERVESIRESILALITELYAKIDYPEEDLSSIPRDELSSRIGAICSDCSRLLDTYRTGYAVTSGIRAVICGRANAGKSTLYNAFLGYEAAIVTEIEGTTRDVLEHTVSVGNVTLRLCDTAGLRSDTDDKVEQIGIGRTRNVIDLSELVIAVFDTSRPLDREDIALAEELSKSDKTVIAVLSKADITREDFDVEFIRSRFEYTVTLHAKDGDIEPLKKLIESIFIDEDINIGKDAVLTDERQSAALTVAVTSLKEAVRAADTGYGEDVCAMYAESALSALSELSGKEISEQIVDGIFSKFCVGK